MWIQTLNGWIRSTAIMAVSVHGQKVNEESIRYMLIFHSFAPSSVFHYYSWFDTEQDAWDEVRALFNTPERKIVQ